MSMTETWVSGVTAEMIHALKWIIWIYPTFNFALTLYFIKWKQLGWQQLSHKVMSGISGCWGRRLSAQSTATDLQPSYGLQLKSRTVLREFHGMGFPLHYITKCDAKRWTQRLKEHETCSLEGRLTLLVQITCVWNHSTPKINVSIVLCVSVSVYACLMEW